MMPAGPLRIGYVLKRYPRYSETFVVTEIRAHEESGVPMHVFAVDGLSDGHFQDAIARVAAPVRYLRPRGTTAGSFWDTFDTTSGLMPGWAANLVHAKGTEIRHLQCAMRLAAMVRSDRIDHLHAHFASEATTIARLAARFAGVPYSLTLHAKDIFHMDVRRDLMERNLTEAAAAVTVSDFNLRYLHETYGPAAERVTRIYNGIRLDEFAYYPPVNRDRLIVGIGRLVEKKGFAHLVDACGWLNARGIPFQCRIVGAGEQEARLRARIERLQLADSVVLAGPLPQSEIVTLLRSASVLAAPCVVGGDGNRDGLPTVLLEAMALGTPCVATDVTGVPEAVRHEETGLVVSQGDAAALGAAVERLLDDPELRVRLAARARRLVEREFDSGRNAAAIRALFAGARNRAKTGPDQWPRH
jgi:colanic acid/amylovoran biosynthesis glycosyltransferase